VEDAAEATVAALGLERGETINVAGPEVVSIRRIAELAAAELGLEPRFTHGPTQSGLVASIERMRDLLVAPTTPPAEGLRRMVAAHG
jgi:nucleoside-diphosphate-sugar epimerase